MGDFKLPCNVGTGVAVGVWWFASAITQVKNKEALAGGMPACALVFSQLLLGSAVGYLLDKISASSDAAAGATKASASALPSADAERPPSAPIENGDGGAAAKAASRPVEAAESPKTTPSDPAAAAMLVMAGTLNAMGHVSTMWSTNFIPTALAHTIRGAESIVVALMSSAIGLSVLQLRHWVIILFIFVGIATDSVQDALAPQASSESLMILGVAFAIGADLFLGTRTVLGKMYGKFTGQRARYLVLCRYGVVVLLLPTLLSGATPEHYLSTNNIIACVGHITYSEASFFVLSRMDPVSHGVLKTFSRACIVLSTAIVFHYSLTLLKAVSLMLTFTGILLYACNKPKGASGFELSASARAELTKYGSDTLPALIVCVLLLFSSFAEEPQHA